MTGNCFNDLLNVDEETTPDELWIKTKEVIHKCAKRTLRKRPVKKKSEYLSSETLQLIDERRKCKAKGERERSNRLTKEIRRMTRNDKNTQINQICEEIQENAHANQPRDLFRHVKHLTGKTVPKLEVVKDANGQILTESDDIKRRWKEYCEQLFKKDGHVTSTPLTFSDYEDCLLYTSPSPRDS